MAALAALFASVASCSGSSAAAETARLNAIFSACAQGRSIAKDEELAIRAIGGNLAARYGEITPRGFRTLAARLEIAERDIFADLGSGVGKACHQAVQEYNVRAACGVELSKTRHDRAVEARRALASEDAERIALVNGDCADAALWSVGALADATVLWICSELMSDGLMRRIGERVSGSAAVRAVATLKPFPGGLDGYARQELPERCEMSWTAALSNPNEAPAPDAGAPVLIYERRR